MSIRHLASGEPPWRGERFKAIDTSVSTLLLQVAKAVGGMFVAFTAAYWTDRALGLGTSSVGNFWLEGLIFTAFATISISVTSARPIRLAIKAQRKAIEDYEERLRVEARRHAFASNLQDALEMAETESEALGVTSEAFAEIAPLPAEMLLADSSRSHLNRAVVSRAHAQGPGCQVESPWRCPAVRRGQTLQFHTSVSIAACPKLRGRPTGACSAICVPVTVLGAPTGVLHMTGPDGTTRNPEQVIALEALASQVGSRVGMIRAMARSERQAATDPLTGLVNRRSLETEVRGLREEGTPYAVVLADLDHFKHVNDTFGHETGDRALRIFARTMCKVIRQSDVACRYGGEEFVVLLPGSTVIEGSEIAHRVRFELAKVCESGEVPAFSCSFGVADSTYADRFEEVLHHADSALLGAKRAGRDRVLIADEGGVDDADDDYSGARPFRPVGLRLHRAPEEPDA